MRRSIELDATDVKLGDRCESENLWQGKKVDRVQYREALNPT